MSFPWLFEGNFSPGTNAEWDSESDTGGKLDFPHYTDLARVPGMGVPYRGAYCARIVMGDTNDHTLTAGAFNISANGTYGVRFALFFAADFTASADDVFNILELQASATIEIAIGIRITAATDVIEIGVGEVTATAFAVQTLTRGRWYQIEVHGDIDNADSSGSGTLRIDGAGVASVTGLTQSAITDAVFGSQLTESTTTGTMLLDEFVADDTRVGVLADRWPQEIMLTKTGHVFVGSGTVENVTLISGNGTNNILDLYDSDEADSTDIYNSKAHLANTAANEIVDPAGMPVEDMKRGCYVVMSGTDPRCIVKVSHLQAWGSEGSIRQYGLRR